MRYVKTYEQIRAGQDYYLLMTDDEKFFVTINDRRTHIPVLDKVDNLVTGDFDVYGYTDEKEAIEAMKGDGTGRYVVQYRVKEPDMTFDVLKYRDDSYNEGGETYVRLKNPLKLVEFFVGGFQKEKDEDYLNL